MTVTSKLNPYPVVGFPTLVLDKPGGYGFHVLGYLLAYTHTLERGRIGSQFVVGFMHPYDRPLHVADITHGIEFNEVSEVDKLYQNLFGCASIATCTCGAEKEQRRTGKEVEHKAGCLKKASLVNMKKIVDALPSRLSLSWTRKRSFTIPEHRNFLRGGPERKLQLQKPIETPPRWGEPRKKLFGLSPGASEIDRKTIIETYVGRISPRKH